MEDMEAGQEEQKNKEQPKRFSFAKNIVVTYGGGLAELHLRRPTAKELNAFDKQAMPVARKGLQPGKIDTVGARVALFNAIFLKAVNFEDEAGPIPEDGKDRIPDDHKNFVILNHVQSNEDIDEKN